MSSDSKRYFVNAGDIFELYGDPLIYIATKTGQIDKGPVIRINDPSMSVGVNYPGVIYPILQTYEIPKDDLSKIRTSLAGMAMQGLVSNPGFLFPDYQDNGKIVASAAVKYADYLIEELEKTK